VVAETSGTAGTTSGDRRLILLVLQVVTETSHMLVPQVVTDTSGIDGTAGGDRDI
jgi:hypothetical protein